MEDLKLKPCPFCGGEAKLIKRSRKTGFYTVGGTYYIHCKECLISTHPRKNAYNVVESWNRRAENGRN